MIVMAGAFPTEFPFPDSPEAFPQQALDRLPPRYRQYASRELPPNPDQNSFMHRMLRGRREEGPSSLFWWVRKERELIAELSVRLEKADRNSKWDLIRSAVLGEPRRPRP
jgi:hypothetical protein